MSHEDAPPAGEPEADPAGRRASRRRGLPRRAAIAAVVGAAVLAFAAVTAGAVVAAQSEEAPTEAANATGADAAGAGSSGTGADQTGDPPPDGEGTAAPPRGHHGNHGRHRHDPLPPYDQRYGDATEEERHAADELLASVRTTLAEYADVDAAVAAGYVAPRRPRGPIVHSVDRSVAEEGRVLDPTRPNGLVYGTDPAGESVLLGAFFVAPPGAPAPAPAGELVVWHSHARSCPAFLVTADAPCTDARRMVHVWTVERVELAGRDGDAVELDVVDPFGAPFRASVARAG